MPAALISSLLFPGLYNLFSFAFSNCWQNFSLDWCKQPDVGLPKPDLILFLQLQLLDAAARGEFGLERYETGTFQEQVLLCFQQLMKDKNLNWKVSPGYKTAIEKLCGSLPSADIGTAVVS